MKAGRRRLTGMRLAKVLARRLKQVREAQGLTQEALARKAKLSLGYVSRLEQARHDAVRLSTLERLARALGVSVADLLK